MSEYKYNVHRDPPDKRDYKFLATIEPKQLLRLPKTVDLRPKCPKIYNQSWLGSCTSHAGSAAQVLLEGNPQSDFSELYLYYMERLIEGTIDEDNGACMRTICKALHKYGICEEKYMPYIPENFRIPPSEEAHKDALNHRINTYRSLHSLQQIKECLAIRRQPVLIGMNVYESFEYIGKDGKLEMPTRGEKLLGGHAVLAVGYVDGFLSWLFGHNGYLIVRNSWGEKWGDEGYFYMKYNYINTGHAWDFWTIE